MSIKKLNGEPTSNWSLEKLGQYCKERSDRMAVDAWLTGKAMAIAKSKTKHGGFTDWKRKWGYSDATVSRYIRLFEQHKTPDALAGKGIMEALSDAGIHQKPATAPPSSVLTARTAAPAVAKRSSAKPPPDKPTKFDWAVDDTSEFEALGPADADDGVLDDEGVLRVEIATLPLKFKTLNRLMDWIVGRDKSLRTKAWPKDQTPAIRSALAELKKACTQLEKVIPK